MDFISTEDFNNLKADQIDDITKWSDLVVGYIYKIVKINVFMPTKWKTPCYLLDCVNKQGVEIRVWAPKRLIKSIVHQSNETENAYFTSFGIEKHGAYNTNIFDIAYQKKQQAESIFFKDVARIPFPEKDQI